MRVQTSVMRISSVGNFPDGRISHQILVASSMIPLRTSTSTVRWNSPKLSKRCGSPVRGSS